MVGHRPERRRSPTPSRPGCAGRPRAAASSRSRRRWTAREAADAAIRRSQFQAGYAVEQPGPGPAQPGRAARLARLPRRTSRAAAVVPPPAAGLVDPYRLAAPFEQLRDRRGAVVPGIAQVDPRGGRSVTVLPAETIRAVSESFRRVGLPEVPGGDRPARPTPAAASSPTPGAPPRSPSPPTRSASGESCARSPGARSRSVTSSSSAARRSGLDQTGVYVGNDRLIVAEPETGTAGVQVLPAGRVLGVRRVTLPVVQTAAPAPTGGICGLEPAAAGHRHRSRPAADAGGRTTTSPPGSARPVGCGPPASTPARTSRPRPALPWSPRRAGVVTVEHPGWAGNLVRIDHGGGVETLVRPPVGRRRHPRPDRAAGPGDRRRRRARQHHRTAPALRGPARRRPGRPGRRARPAGDAAAGVRQRRRSPTTRCAPPPRTACSGCAATPPSRSGSSAPPSPRPTARPCASPTPTGPAAGRRTCSTASRTSPRPPAPPCTAGACAVDLCGGVERFDTAEHEWMLAHGPAYGWIHPSWAGAGGSRPEPWHFEYGA